MRCDDARPVSRRAAVMGLLSLATGACSTLAFVAANVPAVFGSHRRRADVGFGPLHQHRLDIYTPAATSPGPRPLVVFWYGGRWTNGDKEDYRFVGAALASLGMVAVLPNYRHYPEVKMPGFMADAALAVAWAHAHAGELGADPQRLFLMGHSAGAHLAALVTLDQRYLEAINPTVPPIAGVIGLSGPYDFLPLTEDDTRDMFGPPPLYDESQPIHFVHQGAPPMLLVHGLGDDTVRPKNSINLAAALKAQGVPTTLKLYPKLTHTDTVAALSIPARGRAPTLTDIAAFVSPPPSS
jgi:acetyl esterase/lipase